MIVSSERREHRTTSYISPNGPGYPRGNPTCHGGLLKPLGDIFLPVSGEKYVFGDTAMVETIQGDTAKTCMGYAASLL